MADAPEPTASHSLRICATSAIVRGAFGFAGVSLGGFAVWALAGKWFYARVGEGGLYAACAIVFLGLSGVLLHPLIAGPRPMVRFYKVFIPAFIGYAAAWCGAWFALQYGAGEWLGSFLGTVVFAAIAGKMLGSFNGFGIAVLVLFFAHSAGYFLGGMAMHHLGGHLPGGLTRHQAGIIAKLSWGLLYGLGFGAGLGYMFFKLQEPKAAGAAQGK